MPKGQTPRQRKFRKETKPLRQATRMINDSLEKIKKTRAISHLPLIKQSRLSVMPIDFKSWKIIYKMGKISNN